MKKLLVSVCIIMSLLLMMGLVSCSMSDQMPVGSINEGNEVAQEVDENGSQVISEQIGEGEFREIKVISMDEQSVSPVPVVTEDDEAAATRDFMARWRIKVAKNSGMTAPFRYYTFTSATLYDTWSDGTKVTDSISGIYVKPGYEAIVYRYTNFKGEYLLLRANSSTSNYWNLSKLSIGNGMNMDNRISSIEIRWAKKVKGITYRGKDPNDSECGSELNVESIQGIAHSYNYWYLSKNGRIYRCHKDNMKDVISSTGIGDLPYSSLRKYDHYGDMDYYNGKLYVATTGGGVPIVIVYDEFLNYKGYYRFPTDRQSGAGWVAINPVNGLLYSTDEYKKLKVYKMPTLSRYGSTLSYQFSVSLDFGSLGHSAGSWWNNVWNQGGAFDPYGNFYYVLDHKTHEQSGYTGFYIFEITGRKGRARWRQNIKYDPDYFNGKWRRGELEGITYWDRSNQSKYTGNVHQLFLSNENNDEDDITVFHYELAF